MRNALRCSDCDHPSRNAFWVTCALLLLGGLSACGGGSGGGSSSTSNGSPGNSSGSTSSSGGGSSSSSSGGSSSTMPSVSADATQFSPTASPGDPPPNYQVHLTVNDPSSMPIYYTYTYDPVAIQGVNISFPNPTTVNTAQTATLSFALWAPALLGSGVYQGQIRVQFCLDQQCQSPVAGAPIVVSVAYTVTGNVVSSSSYQVLPTGSFAVEAPDTAGSATATATVYTSQLPPYTTYLIGRSQENGIVANGAWQVSQQGSGFTGTLAVNLKSPNSLGPGIYSDVITISICYDQACTKQAIGSPWVLPVQYTVTATEGVDYQAHMLKASVSDVAWSSVQGKLYAVTTAGSSLSPSSLLEVDPTNAVVTRSVALGGSPTALSVSDDGAYAYIAFSDQSVVKRIALSSLSLDLTIALPPDPMYGPTFAGYVLAMPGSPHSVAISSYSTFAPGLSDFDSRGSYLYDDATVRPNTFLAPDAVTRVMGLSWGADSTTLYAYDGNQQRLFTASTSLTGLSLANTATGVANAGGGMYFLNGLLYLDDGGVTNPSTGARVAQFFDKSTVTQPAVAVDATLNRAYYFYEEQLSPVPTWTFATYDLQTRAVYAKTRVSACSSLTSLTPGGPTKAGGRLVRWGSNGLAANCGDGLEIISGMFVSP